MPPLRTSRLAALLVILSGCAGDESPVSPAENAASQAAGAAAAGAKGTAAEGGRENTADPMPRATGNSAPKGGSGVLAADGRGGAEVSVPADSSGGANGSGGAGAGAADGGAAPSGLGGADGSMGGMGAVDEANSGGAGGIGGGVPALPPREGPMKLTSPTFEAEGMLEPKTLCQGGNVSPPLRWTRGPEGTLSYAVTMVHEGNRALHWALWDIPATTLEVPEDVAMVPEPPAPAGTKQHRADLDGFTFHGHIGGCPGGPKAGPGRKGRYEYEAIALDVETLSEITPESSSDDVASALSAHKLEGGIIVGVGRSPE